MNARPKKHLGQHFLVDHAVIERMLHAVRPAPGQKLVEIGPGEGVLTEPLLQAAGELTAIELDRDLHQPLLARCSGRGNLHLIQADVLDIDLSRLAADSATGKLRLVGNLPYYLSSPILFHCLDHLDALSDMHFMLQREVVERMVAAPGSKIYGRLSVMLQLACHAEMLFTVPPEAFRPPPKVDSAVVRLLPLAARDRPDVDPTVLSRVVRAAFGQRRKTLANALRGVLDVAAIAATGVDPKARAETLAPTRFVALAQQIRP